MFTSTALGIAGQSLAFVSRRKLHVVHDCRYVKNIFQLGSQEVFRRRAEDTMRHVRDRLSLGIEGACKQLGTGEF